MQHTKRRFGKMQQKITSAVHKFSTELKGRNCPPRVSVRSILPVKLLPKALHWLAGSGSNAILLFALRSDKEIIVLQHHQECLRNDTISTPDTDHEFQTH
jgi:hypothetical protein